MKSAFILLFVIMISNACSQFRYIYTSTNDPDYFPAKLYLKPDKSFIYQESMDKHHANNEYFETGTYKVHNDTLYLTVSKIGFTCDKLVNEPASKVAVFDKNNLYLIRENGGAYLKLRKKKLQHAKAFSDCFD